MSTVESKFEGAPRRDDMISSMLAHSSSAASRWFRRAVAWWLEELAGMRPVTTFRRLGATASDGLLDLTGAEPSLAVRRQGSKRNGGASATVLLDAADLFVTTLELPRAAERSLDAVLRHQVERIVPLPSAQTCFAYRVRPRRPEDATLTVVVAVAKTAHLDRALATARESGLAPRRIVANVAQAGPAPLVLWQVGQARDSTPSRRNLLRGLEAAAVVLWLFAFGLHVFQLNRVRDELRDALPQARQLAAAARNLGQRAEQSAEALTFLRSRRQEPTGLAVLARLTTLLPLDSWISDISLRGNTVEIVGSAPHATDLITLIGGSGVFASPRFRSPVTLLPDGRSERFDLTFDVAPVRQP